MKKIIITVVLVMGLASIQLSAQTVTKTRATQGTSRTANAQAATDAPAGVVTKTKNFGTAGTPKPTSGMNVSNGTGTRPQPATANPNGPATVVTTPGNPNGKVKTAPKN